MRKKDIVPALMRYDVIKYAVERIITEELQFPGMEITRISEATKDRNLPDPEGMLYVSYTWLMDGILTSSYTFVSLDRLHKQMKEMYGDLV